MARSKPTLGSKAQKNARESISLKTLAEHLGLSKTAVSLGINRVPAAKSIPHRTQELIRAAARELNYRPNHLARSLRQQRSYTIGVLVPEISEGYAALVMSGIEDHLLQEGYFYFVVSHRHRNELIEEYPLLLQQRAVEGLVAVDTALSEGVQVPLVAVSGHRDLPGVTNIVLNHARGATLALEHLAKLGHRQMAFIKGQEFSSDTAVRWDSVRGAEFLPFDEGHLTMPEFRKMFQRKRCASCMVENDIRNARQIPVARDGHERDLHSLGKSSIHGYQAFYRALL